MKAPVVNDNVCVSLFIMWSVAEIWFILLPSTRAVVAW